jgi:predicted O-methyltransferase YrrM
MAGWFKKRGGWENFTYLKPLFMGKSFKYLELGVFEGDSLEWVARNLATHPESTCVGIDPWLPMKGRDAENMKAIRDTAATRLSKYPSVLLRQKYSSKYLRSKKVKQDGPFDFVYIDSDHYAPFVLEDTILVWPHIKNGGILVWDDFGLNLRRPARRRNLGVETAVPAFLSCFTKGDCYEVINLPNRYQYGVRKLRDERSIQVDETGTKIRGEQL